MARRYQRGTRTFRAHGEGLGKGYRLSGRDARDKRARHRYEPTSDPNRLAMRRDIDALDRDREREMADLFHRVHRELRAETRRHGKPPRNFLLNFRGRILSSRDPDPLPREEVAKALLGKMKSTPRKKR
jgi:hypothetical protein